MCESVSNAFTKVHNTLKEMPFDCDFLKYIMVVPVVGHVVQIWKRSFLSAEVAALEPDYESKKGILRTLSRDEISKKAQHLDNFAAQSFNYGRFGDVALIIIGIALGFFVVSPAIICFSLGFGVASLFGRKILYFYDSRKLSQLNSEEMDDTVNLLRSAALQL